MVRHAMFFLALTGLFSCTKEDEFDPELIGTWSNAFQRVTFLENGRFGQRYTNPSVVNDSIFGTYTVDGKRKNVTLEGEGYRIATSDSIVYQDLTNQTWNYEISGTTMNIESPTLSTNFVKTN